MLVPYLAALAICEHRRRFPSTDAKTIGTFLDPGSFLPLREQLQRWGGVHHGVSLFQPISRSLHLLLQKPPPLTLHTFPTTHFPTRNLLAAGRRDRHQLCRSVQTVPQIDSTQNSLS